MSDEEDPGIILYKRNARTTRRGNSRFCYENELVNGRIYIIYTSMIGYLIKSVKENIKAINFQVPKTGTGYLE